MALRASAQSLMLFTRSVGGTVVLTETLHQRHHTPVSFRPGELKTFSESLIVKRNTAHLWQRITCPIALRGSAHSLMVLVAPIAVCEHHTICEH